MTGLDIKKRIEANNQKIEALFDPVDFVLSEEISALLQENEHLQSICEHIFENGRCKFCYKEEEKR